MKIVVDKVSIAAGHKTLVEDLSLVLPSASVSVVLGRNGAGKSTLLRALAGVAPLSGGSIHFEHLDTLRATINLHTISAAERARYAAWVPTHSAIPFAFKVLDLVILGRFAKHQGRPSRSDRCAAEAALVTVGAAALAQRSIASLSSGELARVAIARGLAAETPVLLLDEPIANLDVGAALALMQTLKTLATAGRTIVLSLHDLTAAFRFADYAACLADGQLVAAGPAKTVLSPLVIHQTFQVKASPAQTADGRETLVFDA